MTLSGSLSKAVSGLALSFLLLGCDNSSAGQASDSADVLANNIPVKLNGAVSLEVSGKAPEVDLKVSAWDRPYVKVTLIKSYETSTNVETLSPAVEGGASLRINVDATSSWFSDVIHFRRAEASIRVQVPREVRLNLTAHNGAVEIEKIVGAIDVKTDNGPVDISGAGSVVHVDAQNGPISVTVADTSRVPDIRISLVDGPIELDVPRDFKSEIETRVTFGPVNVDSSIRTGPGTVDLRTVAGPIDVEQDSARVNDSP